MTALVYLGTTVLFILGLKGLAHPKTALRGNSLAMLGMGLAIVFTMSFPEVKNYTWILAGLSLGAAIGIPLARKIQMTAMPQLVAILHSFVGLSATLVAIGTFMLHQEQGDVSKILALEVALGAAIGAITFTGSVVAFAKLQELMSSAPLQFLGQHVLNLALLIGTLGLTGYFLYDQSLWILVALTALSLVLGLLLVLPIGGADMPVIVSMLNSYSGWAASATGFTLSNPLLIATGALVGSSGAILSYIMCKAMNRSVVSVVLGGFGSETGTATQSEERPVKSAAPEDAAYVMENSSSVIIVPGYGMAVAQAQHAVKDLYKLLAERKIDVKFAIHPVAGRMPGHMNVLLAESEIPYDVVFEMDDINSEFSQADVALIIGANDVVNPAAKTDKKSPLFGMPILDAFKTKQIFVLKRSRKAGYAGVDNDLFYYENCALVFGDAKATIEAMNHALRGAGH